MKHTNQTQWPPRISQSPSKPSQLFRFQICRAGRQSSQLPKHIFGRPIKAVAVAAAAGGDLLFVGALADRNQCKCLLSSCEGHPRRPNLHAWTPPWARAAPSPARVYIASWSTTRPFPFPFSLILRLPLLCLPQIPPKLCRYSPKIQGI